ncbi:MAG: hypothetical protein MI864_16155 [Pseudomonadales bacterium]|nr:hypothetical protein [Pseudomonadales bacterium]
MTQLHNERSDTLTENERLAVTRAFNDFFRSSRITGLQHIYLSTMGFQSFDQWSEYAVDNLFPLLPRDMGLDILKQNNFAFWTRETLRQHISGSMLDTYGFKPEQPDRYEVFENEIRRLRDRCEQLTEDNMDLRFRESPFDHLFKRLGSFSLSMHNQLHA